MKYNPLSNQNAQCRAFLAWRQGLVENVKFVELGKERYPVTADPKTRFATSGLRIRRKRDSWVGTEIPVGADDTLWEEGDAVPQRWPDGRYVANVVEGKVTLYGRRGGTGRSRRLHLISR